VRIIVLGSSSSWYVNDLRRAAAGRHEIAAVSYKQLASQIDGHDASWHAGGIDLGRADAILVRSMPPGSLEQVVFRMDALGQLASAGMSVVNSPRAIEVAVDKYLATARLQEAGFLVPPTVACQTVEQAMQAFETLGRDVVVKPLFGGEGRGVTRVTNEAIARQTFQELDSSESVLYLQAFIDHDGCDWRLLVIGQRVLGMGRRHPTDWRTNISRGAVGEPLEVTPDLAEMAHKGASAVGATIAGVDLLPGNDGQLYALEVNAVPGWRALAKVCEQDVSRLVLDHLASLG